MKIFRVVIVFLLIFVVLGFVLYGAMLYFNTPEKSTVISDKGTIITINAGDSVSVIAGKLKKKDLVRSAKIMILYAKIMGSSRSFKVGHYRIYPGEKMTSIHDELIAGKQQLYAVTIPEGWTIKKIGKLLENKHITTAEEFYKACSSTVILKKYAVPSNTVEGYIFPDTYYFQQKFPAEKIVSFFIETFFKKILEIYPDYKKLGKYDLYQKIILASIVEREYRLPEEAPVIASVFYNRLKKNMSLGSCATIAYIITDIEGKKHPSRITYADLEINSSFNTYRHKGLPPSPISNPGSVALHSVFYPAKTNYMFFVLEDPVTGKHKFTTTYQDHLIAKNLYIKSK